MPKPAQHGQPDRSERGAAGYLGRMQAAEKNLTNAKPFSLPQQKGTACRPGLTNFALTPEQQVSASSKRTGFAPNSARNPAQ